MFTCSNHICKGEGKNPDRQFYYYHKERIILLKFYTYASQQKQFCAQSICIWNYLVNRAKLHYFFHIINPIKILQTWNGISIALLNLIQMYPRCTTMRCLSFFFKSSSGWRIQITCKIDWASAKYNLATFWFQNYSRNVIQWDIFFRAHIW